MIWTRMCHKNKMLTQFCTIEQECVHQNLWPCREGRAVYWLHATGSISPQEQGHRPCKLSHCTWASQRHQMRQSLISIALMKRGASPEHWGHHSQTAFSSRDNWLAHYISQRGKIEKVSHVDRKATVRLSIPKLWDPDNHSPSSST